MTGPTALAQTDHESDFGRWTLYRRKPRPALAPYVHELQGYFEEGGAAIMRREVPSGVIPLILVFGPGFTLHDRSRDLCRRLDRSFVAGLHREHVLVGSAGRALCMQVDFTPWGARRFLRTDMSELADRVFDLNAVTGAFAERLEERLAETQSWEHRFDLVEDTILRRIGDADDDAVVIAAWRRLEQSHGAVAIADLARDLDCSRKHLAALFRRNVGLPPKTMARIFRFERALQRLAEGRFPTLAALASDCGYSDQAHFNRDFTAFAGETPGDLKTRILADGTGIMAPGW
jgi:AraC-like DNA-binding protein